MSETQGKEVMDTYIQNIIRYGLNRKTTAIIKSFVLRIYANIKKSFK